MTATIPSPDDFELEQTAAGEYCCPVDSCDATSETERGVGLHYGVMKDGAHDDLLALHIVSEDEWRAFLREKSRQRTPYREIAASLPDHLGRTIVTESLDRYELWYTPTTGGHASVLAKQEVTTIEEAREYSKQIANND